MTLNNFRKILCPRFDTLGDIVLFEGFIEAFKSNLPDCEITLVVRSSCVELIDLFPPDLKLDWANVDLDAYGAVNQEHLTLFDSFLAELDGCWDLVLFSAFNSTWLDYRLAEHFSNVPQIVIGDAVTSRYWPISSAIIVTVEKDSHEIDKYAVLYRHFFGSNYSLPLPKLDISPEYKKAASEVLKELGISGVKYVVIFPAGTRNQSKKAWPLDRFVEVVSWITVEYRFTPLLLGHISERDTVNTLAMMLEAKGLNTFQWLGADGELPLLAALLDGSCLYVGNDTGPMHIASALGVPTVGIFGGGHSFRFLPVGDHSIGIIGDMPCFGCGWDCIFGDAPCKLLVDSISVQDGVSQVLSDALMTERMINVEKNIIQIFPEIIIKARSERLRLLGLIEKANCEERIVSNMENTEIYNILVRREKELLDVNILVNLMKESFSWRLTEPLRMFGNWVRRWLR